MWRTENHHNATWLFVIFIWQRTAFEWFSRLELQNKHIVVELVLFYLLFLTSDLDENLFSEAFIEDIVKGVTFPQEVKTCFDGSYNLF